MEMNRRIGQGRLAEAFGKDALNTDRLTRTLGFNRLARADQELLSPEYQEYLKIFSDLNKYTSRIFRKKKLNYRHITQKMTLY